MENIGGIFVVLICGLIIAVFVAVMEFIWSTRRSAESEEVRSGRVGPQGQRSLKTVAPGSLLEESGWQGGARESRRGEGT